MILTAMKPVNVRIGSPSVNAPNPSFLLPGDHVNAVKRVIGDIVNDDNEWIFTDKNIFVSGAGFLSKEKVNIPFDISDANLPSVFKELEIGKVWDTFISKGEGISIGIIDVSGVADTPALRKKVVPLNYLFENTTSTNHSTCMASVIAAYKFETGEVGIAPFVNKIYSYKIDDISIPPESLFHALEELKKVGANIINMSIASTVFEREDYNILKNILNSFAENNTLLISSTGQPPQNNKSFPAALDKIISVSGYVLPKPISFDSNSNIWDGVNVSAPYNKYFNHFDIDGGTSYSCAVISGIFACAYEKIINNSLNKSGHDYIVQDILPAFDKITYPKNNTPIFAFDTDKFLNIFK
jgi:hypothetical protein